jgi:hypothetical protein
MKFIALYKKIHAMGEYHSVKNTIVNVFFMLMIFYLTEIFGDKEKNLIFYDSFFTIVLFI